MYGIRETTSTSAYDMGPYVHGNMDAEGSIYHELQKALGVYAGG